MKNSFWKWSLGLSLTGLLPLVGGCLQDHSTAAPPVSTNSQVLAAAASPSAAPTNSAATGETNTTSDEALAADADVVTAPARPVSTEKPLPANVKPTPPTAEIIKLANSGVDESVMLAYVTNSSNTFNLGADEVVYLTDLGVQPSVLTAMIQHDQFMKAGSANVPPSSVASTTGNILVPSPGAPAPYQVPAAASQSQSAPEPVAADPTSLNTDSPPPGEQVQAAPGAPETAPTSQVFYDSLSPYGTWLEVEGYGRVWQPSVVVINRGWRPYYDNGRWVYTNHGWYWYSDYSWGWAPFHYGRWFRHAHYGWCWTPDYVWGPSWVTWRYTSDYCGWAPLPPAAYYSPGFGFSYYGSSVGFNFGFGLGYGCYSFVHFQHFHANKFHHYHRLPSDHVTQIYNKTVVVNKIVGDNNTIINSGVPVENVVRATKREVPRVQVREFASAPVRGNRAEQLDATGTLAVYRPKIPPTESGLVKTAPRRPETLSSPPRSSLSSRSAPTAASAPLVSGSSRIAERPASDPAPGVARQTVAPSTRYAPSRTLNNPSSANAPAGIVVSRPSERPSSVTSSSRSVGRGTETVATPAPSAERGSAPVRQAPPRPSVSSTTPPRAESAPTANTVSPVLPGPNASRPSSEGYVQRPYSSSVERQQAPSRSTTVSPSPSFTAPSRQMPSPMATPSRPSYSAPQRSIPSISSPSPAPRQYVTPTPSIRSQSPASTPSPSYSAPVRPSPSYSAPARPAPSYSSPAPTVRSAPAYSTPAPSPSYSAPARPSPSPSYSAPSRPSPSPSYSAPTRSAPSSPAPSAPSRSYSGGGGRESGSPRQQAL